MELPLESPEQLKSLEKELHDTQTLNQLWNFQTKIFRKLGKKKRSIFQAASWNMHENETLDQANVTYDQYVASFYVFKVSSYQRKIALEHHPHKELLINCLTQEDGRHSAAIGWWNVNESNDDFLKK